MKTVTMCSCRLFLLLLFVFSAFRAQASTLFDDPSMSQDSASSLMFIENAGQFEKGAHFQMRSNGVVFWMAENALWITLMRTEGVSRKPPSAGVECAYDGVHLKLTFPGANSAAKIEPLDRLRTVISYFTGNDPSRWYPSVPVWSGVRYVDLYPGVDLELIGRDGELTPRLVLKDMGSVSTIGSALRLRIEGADGLLIDGDAVVMKTAVGEVLFPLFEVVGPDGASISGPALLDAVETPRIDGVDVVAPFARDTGLLASSRKGRSATASDSPSFYGTYLGGGGSDRGRSIAVDARNNVYATGSTASTNFPVTEGAFQETSNSTSASFIVKFDPERSALVYGTYLSGGGAEFARSIAVDGDGNAYVTGSTSSKDFPVTSGAFQKTYGGGSYDAFVVKLDPSGSSLLYGSYLGGDALDLGYDIALDTANNAMMTGWTASGNFPVTGASLQPTYGGGAYDAFVVKLDASGSSLPYGTFLGGSGLDQGLGIVADSGGNACLTGFTDSGDFPVTEGAFQMKHGGGRDAFIAKLNSAGGALLYATFLGDSGADEGERIAADASGNVYATGRTASGNFPVTENAFQKNHGGGGYDAFAVALSSSGNSLIYSTYLGGGGDDRGTGIAFETAESVYLTGQTGSTNFPVTSDAFQKTYADGDWDSFIVRISCTGASLLYGSFLGGAADDGSAAIAVDTSGNVYATGFTNSTDFPVADNALQKEFGGGLYDAFLIKLSTGAPVLSTGAWVTTAADDTLYYYEAVRQEWKWTPARASVVASVSGSACWFVQTETGSVYRYDDGSWTWTPAKAESISAASENALWLVQKETGNVYHYDEGIWTWTPAKAESISAASESALWLVQKETGNVYHYDDGTWTWTPAQASIISAAGDDVLWLVDKTSGNLYRYTRSSDLWDWTPARPKALSAASDTVVWIADQSGRLYKYDIVAPEPWTWFPAQASLVSAVSGREAFFLDLEGRLCRVSDSKITIIGGELKEIAAYPPPLISGDSGAGGGIFASTLESSGDESGCFATVFSPSTLFLLLPLALLRIPR